MKYKCARSFGLPFCIAIPGQNCDWNIKSQPITVSLYHWFLIFSLAITENTQINTASTKAQFS